MYGCCLRLARRPNPRGMDEVWVFVGFYGLNQQSTLPPLPGLQPHVLLKVVNVSVTCQDASIFAGAAGALPRGGPR